MTVFDSLVGALQKAAAHNRDDTDTVPPAALLWPGEKRDWEKLVPPAARGLAAIPHVRPLQSAHRSSPAILPRCVPAGRIA
ncbi:MAG: hypothetical protein ACYC6M_16130 [Terriglobales bacterium]